MGKKSIDEALSDVVAELEPYWERSVASQYLDALGREIPNSTPVAPPVGYKRAPSIAEQMRQMIKMASYEAAQSGAETEAEANDFDVGEDFEPESPYEHDFEIDPAFEMMLARQSAPPSQPEVPNPPASSVNGEKAAKASDVGQKAE